MRRRVLMVGRTRYALPLSDSLAKKFDALERRVDLRVLATGAGETDGDPRFRLVPPLPSRALDGAAFYATLPLRVARELRAFEPHAVLAQSPFEAAAAYLGRRLAGRETPVVVELHGDWRSFARLYGSRARGLLAPLADRLAAWSVRRADAVRALSPFTVELARAQGAEPAAVFTTWTDLTAFSERPVAPLPERPQALFVGVLEPYKNVDGIAAAWRLAAARVPDARLAIVGDGRRTDLVESLLADLPEQTTWARRLSTSEMVAALDASTCLLLPSRSEGTPRVILEALCRGRPTIGGRVGGIPDAVADGETGLLVDPDDVEGIADALVRLLSDRALAERMGAAARASAEPWLYTADEYADRVAELVEHVAR